MKFPVTLSFYIGRHFLLCMIIVLGVLGTMILLLDGMELIRRSYNKEVPLAAILEMGFLRLPSRLEEVIPFAIMLASILTFTRLTRTSELAVTRAAGISVWQFLTPALVAAFVVGTLTLAVFNPLSSVMLTRYEQLEARYLRGATSMMSVSSSGLWLRQSNPDDRGQAVIHALRVSQEDMRLFDVIIFLFDEGNRFTKRIDAESATLHKGYWDIRDVAISAPGTPAEHYDSYQVKTLIQPSQIQESFASPETMSFWELPAFIETLKSAGFSALRHRLYWHSVLAQPLLLSALVLIGAAFSLSPPRRGQTAILISCGIGVGFVIRFMSNLTSALGMAGTIPIGLAAWAPVVICVFIGMALMLHLEDG